MRHGEAENPQVQLQDHDRALMTLGKEQAKSTAQKIAGLAWLPQQVMCSSALRTVQTAGIACETWGISKQELLINANLYLAPETTISEIIRQLDNHLDTVAIVGHNPGASHAIDYLTGQFCGLSTGCAALIQFEIDDWEVVAKKMGVLVKLISPL